MIRTANKQNVLLINGREFVREIKNWSEERVEIRTYCLLLLWWNGELEETGFFPGQAKYLLYLYFKITQFFYNF